MTIGLAGSELSGTTSNVADSQLTVSGNAEATQFGEDTQPFVSQWICTYGRPRMDPDGARLKGWGNAVRRAKGSEAQVGYWGWTLPDE